MINRLNEKLIRSSVMALPPDCFKVLVYLLAIAGDDRIAYCDYITIALACYFDWTTEAEEAVKGLLKPDSHPHFGNDHKPFITKVKAGYRIAEWIADLVRS